MKITSLQVESFKRLSDKHYYEFPDGIIGITGANGQGKSTIAAAIAWAFFGPDMLPTGKADVVTWGKPRAFVRVTFEINGNKYNVDRLQEKSGRSDAQLVLLNDPHPAQFLSRGLDPTSREVERLLGVDRVGFLTSVYARQEELAGLMSLTPANRIKTVLRLLGVEQLTSAIESVRTTARETRKELEGLRAGYDDPTGIQYQIESIENELEENAESTAIRQEQLADIKNQQEILTNEAVQLIPQRQAYEQHKERLNKAYISYVSAESELRSAERAYEQITPAKAPGNCPDPVDADELDNVGAQLSATRREEQQLQERLESIKKSSKCFACHRPFDHANDLRSQIDEIERRLSVLLQDDEDLYAQLTILRKDRLRYNEWMLRNRAYEQFQERSENAVARIEQARYALAAAHEYREKLNQEPTLEDISEKLDSMYEKRLETEIAAGQVREMLSTLAERDKYLTEEWTKLLDRKKNAIKIFDRINELERLVVLNETTSSELTALKESMIATAIPMISERSSELITKFTDGRYTEIHLTSNYEIQYRNELGELKSFENLSGGEKDVFALALRLAIADLRADSIGVLLLDEVLESLDVDRQEATWNAIERLTNRYNQVFLITHVQAFKDRAATVIAI
jgi:DNA repair protein SbcC/Rad50